MPRITGPLFSAGASGAFAGVCEFRMVNGKAVACAPKHISKTPGAAQQANAARFRDAVNGWKILDNAQKLLWKAKGTLQGLTGYQLYLREYIRQGIMPPNHPVLPA